MDLDQDPNWIHTYKFKTGERCEIEEKNLLFRNSTDSLDPDPNWANSELHTKMVNLGLLETPLSLKTSLS